MKVAIIGGGPASLAALRHLTRRRKVFHPVAYEKAKTIGGVWCYKEGICKKPTDHTNVYASLRWVTNLKSSQKKSKTIYLILFF